MPKKTASDLEAQYVDAIQDAFLVVQEEYETDADQRLAAQTLALRQCLADCQAYQQELDEETKIAHYGDDLPDDIMPRELNNAAA